MADDSEATATAVVPTPFAGELLHMDLLRFVASAGIVMAHSLEFLAPPAIRPWWRMRLAGLPLFVDTFFIVSGYIIARLYADRMADWRDYLVFLQRRVARLVPLHLATVACWLLLYAALVALHVALHHVPSLTPACIATASLLLTSFVDCGGLPVAEANWSISAEIVMYLLFPLWLIVTRRRAWTAALLAAALFALVLADYGGATRWQINLDVGRALPAFVAGLALCFAEPLAGRMPLREPASR